MLNNQNSGEGQLLQQQSDLGQPPSPLVIGRRKKNSVQTVKAEFNVLGVFCDGLWLFFMYSEYHSMSFDTSLRLCESNVV